MFFEPRFLLWEVQESGEGLLGAASDVVVVFILYIIDQTEEKESRRDKTNYVMVPFTKDLHNCAEWVNNKIK